MIKFGSIISVLMLLSCTAGIDLNSVDYETLFNDDNSKVWLVNKVYKGNSIVSSTNNYEKDVMIFYKGGGCDFIPMKDITRVYPQSAIYNLNSKARMMYIEFKDYSMEFSLSYITEDSIMMLPTEQSEYEFGIQLIPFQRL